MDVTASHDWLGTVAHPAAVPSTGRLGDWSRYILPAAAPMGTKCRTLRVRTMQRRPCVALIRRSATTKER